MRTRKLGYTELHLTTVGLGAWAMGGGDWQYGWGPQDDTQSLAAISEALDRGINWVDTAAVYGLGHSEEIVGRAIAGRRDQVIVATKCSRVWDKHGRLGGSLKAQSIRRECEASLKRLNLETIDLYQIHWPDPEEEIEEGWTEIARLIGEGKVRYGGVSNFSVAQLKRCQKIHPVASLQPPYSMLRRGVEEELLPFCYQNEIGVVAYSPMECGLLTGKMTRRRMAALPDNDWRKHSPRFREPALSANLAVAQGLGEIAAPSGRTAAQLAIAWVLRRPEVTAAIVGARTPQQIEETAPAGDWALSPEELTAVEELLKKHKAA